MPCIICAKIDASCSKHPFSPPDGKVNTHFYQCPECKQWWMQFNKKFHCWQRITDEQRNGSRIEARIQSHHS